MLKNKFVLIILILQFLMACNNTNNVIKTIKYKDGKTKMEQIKINGDNLNSKFISYYPNGDTELVCHFVNDTILNGEAKTYYHNNKLESQGFWKDGFKIGEFKYFDSIGRLQKIISYIRIPDTSISKPNQIIYFNLEGDTIKGSPSFYYKIVKPDTIENGKVFKFNMTLIGKVYSNTFITFCDYEKVDGFLGPSNCNSLNLNTDSSLSIIMDNYTKGVNVLSGYFTNYINYKEKGKPKTKYGKIYFVDSFFVK